METSRRNWTDLPVRALLFAGFCAFVVLFALNSGSVRLPGGPLDELGNGFSGVQPVGVPFSAGLFALDNRGGRTLKIDAVRLGPHTRGLELLGVRAYGGGRGSIAFLRGFPPRRWPPSPRRPKLSFIHGLEIRLHGRKQLVVGLRVGHPGRFVLRGLDVAYRVHYLFGLPVPYRRHITMVMVVCAGPDARRTPCKPPSSG
ncbi:MAG: hypothetical protein M3R70_13330 [Actinomycetota bacterium]|nr:hypothetical protein [Actinomycetota bacterium]